MDSSSGKCCYTNSTDGCKNDQYYCSNTVSSTGLSYHKYAFCSFDPLLCGSPSRNLRSREVAQTIITGINFNSSDACPYYIVTDSKLPFNTQVQITIDSAANTDIYLLTGTSLASLSSQQKLSSGSSYTIDASSIGVLILKATSTSPIVQFTFKNIQILSTAAWIGILIGSASGYFLMIIISLIFITKYLTKRRLRILQQPNIFYFLRQKANQYLSMNPKDNNINKYHPQDYQNEKKIVTAKNIDSPNIYKNDKTPPLSRGYESGILEQTDQLSRVGTAAEEPKQQKDTAQDCYSCLTSTTTTNKYCLSYDDAPSGYCCDTTSTTDVCAASSKYQCTDNVAVSSMKIYLCPTSSSKCFSSSSDFDFDANQYSKIIYAGDQASQVGGTTLSFGQNDTCAWRIIADTQYVSDKKIKLTINSLYQASCYINYGSNIKSASGEISCAASTEYDFNADQNIFITLQGLTQGASFRFSYQLEDRLSITQISVMYSLLVFFFVLLAGALAIMVVRYFIQREIEQNQKLWFKKGIEMKEFVSNAEKQKQMQQLSTIEDYLQEHSNRQYSDRSQNIYKGKPYYNKVHPDIQQFNDRPQFNLY